MQNEHKYESSKAKPTVEEKLDAEEYRRWPIWEHGLTITQRNCSVYATKQVRIAMMIANLRNEAAR